MKRIFTIAVVICCAGLLWLMNRPHAPVVQALNNAVTMLPTNSPHPTNTEYPTMTPYPTVDYRATDQAYQLAMEQQRNDMIKAQLAHDEEMLAQQVELARINGTATAAGTQVAQIHAENTLQAGQLTAVSIQATSTAEAPQQAAALLQVAIDAKDAKSNNIRSWVGTSFLCLFFLTGSIFFVKKSKTIKVAEIMNELQEDDPADYEPVPAREATIEIQTCGINRRMEQRFAQVLLAMHQLQPNDEAVNLLESFWIVRGSRDKFQNRDEFLAVRDDWASEENGILKRLNPTLTNSTFYVAKWDEVQEIANGSRLQPPPQDGFIPYSRQK